MLCSVRAFFDRAQCSNCRNCSQGLNKGALQHSQRSSGGRFPNSNRSDWQWFSPSINSLIIIQIRECCARVPKLCMIAPKSLFCKVVSEFGLVSDRICENLWCLGSEWEAQWRRIGIVDWMVVERPLDCINRYAFASGTSSVFNLNCILCKWVGHCSQQSAVIVIVGNCVHKDKPLDASLTSRAQTCKRA